MPFRLVLALLLVGHGAVHGAFLAPRPPATAGGPEWRFDLGHSWALGPLGVSPALARVIGVALFVGTISGFAFAALAALGVLPSGMWAPSATIRALASVTTLILLFHPWLVAGVAIDVVILGLVFSSWWSPAGT